MLQRLRFGRVSATGGVLAALLIGATMLYAAGRENPSGSEPPPLTSSASGALSITDNLGEGAIFHLSNFAPAMSADGEVTITNSGTAAGVLTLSAFDRSDSPGLYGGVLSDQLELLISDVTNGAAKMVYAGELARMPELSLGSLAPGAGRTLRFTVRMRDGGVPATPYVGDNLYQRATASLSYRWTLTEIEGGGPPETPSEPPVPPPPGPLEAPPAPGAPNQRVLRGTGGPDTLIGTPQADLIRGLGGADRIFGRGGNDRLYGGGGPDRIKGGAGADLIVGGPSGDILEGDSGRDRIVGGAGADVVLARDGEADVVDCGPGIDKAYVDVRDKTRACEQTVAARSRR